TGGTKPTMYISLGPATGTDLFGDCVVLHIHKNDEQCQESEADDSTATPNEALLECLPFIKAHLAVNEVEILPPCKVRFWRRSETLVAPTLGVLGGFRDFVRDTRPVQVADRLRSFLTSQNYCVKEIA